MSNVSFGGVIEGDSTLFEVLLAGFLGTGGGLSRRFMSSTCVGSDGTRCITLHNFS